MVIRDETYLVCDSESWRRWLSFTWSKFSVIVTRGEVVAIHSKKTDSLTKTFSFVSFRTAADAICTELQDEKKATYKYLSISGSEYSWNHCGEEKKKALLGNTATNDEAESTLGGTTANIQRFGRIALSSAGAVSDMKRNAFLQRDTIPTKKNPTVNQSGLFHQFPHELRQAIVRVAMKDAPVTKLRNNEDLALQTKARRAKEEMIKAKNMEKATEESNHRHAMVIRDETYLVCDSESWRRWLSFTWSKFSVIVTRGEVVAIHSKKTDSLTKTFSFVSFRTAADAICTELQDEKKATYKYLSISGSEYSWNHCGEEKKKALLGNTATNDEAESTLGGTTANIQRFGRIALSSAGAVSDMKRNAFLQRDTIPTKKKSACFEILLMVHSDIQYWCN